MKNSVDPDQLASSEATDLVPKRFQQSAYSF